MGYGKLISGNVIIEDVALVADLKVNLLSVSQFTDKGFKVIFDKEDCSITNKKTWEVALKGARKGSMFVAYLNSANKDNGKIKRSSHKRKTVNSISAPLQLIHMDMFGPVNVLSISRKKYALVMVDDYSRYTWVKFMHSKDETPHIIIKHIKKVEKQNEDQNSVKRLRSDNGTELRNAALSEFCKDKGIVQ
ncbi:hypothetical protein AgCh_032472 [Apium graveolens]